MKVNSRKPFKRCDRIADQIKKVISQILIKETYFPKYVMVSIADVKVSQDLRNADIYLSFYNREDDFDPKFHFNDLRKNTNNIKYKLGNALKLKYMPKIKFFLSEDYSHYDKINRMLKNDG